MFDEVSIGIKPFSDDQNRPDDEDDDILKDGNRAIVDDPADIPRRQSSVFGLQNLG